METIVPVACPFCVHATANPTRCFPGCQCPNRLGGVEGKRASFLGFLEFLACLEGSERSGGMETVDFARGKCFDGAGGHTR